MQQTFHKVLHTQIHDLLALTQHVAHPLASQIRDHSFDDIPETLSLLPRIQTTLEIQAERLSEILEKNGLGEAQGMKVTVSSFFVSPAAVIEKIWKTRISKMLKDDYANLNLLSIHYDTLHVTASGLRETVIADVAQRAKDELATLIKQVRQAMPAVTIKELRDEGINIDISSVNIQRQPQRNAWELPSPTLHQIVVGEYHMQEQ